MRLAIAGVVLALLGLARLSLVVFHEPVLGYGDQYDMVRVGACIGMYPDIPAAERVKTTSWAPVPRYVFEKPEPAVCEWGSETAIAGLAVTAFRAFEGGTAIDLRWIGATKLVLAAILVIAGCALLWRFPGASLLHGATVFALLGDPLASLWFNTLYAEMPIIFGAYAMVLALVATALRGTAGAGIGALLVAGTLALGLSKAQFFLLPLALAAAGLPLLWPASRRVALAALATSLVPVAAFLAAPHTGATDANRIDTYLGALAASSDDPRRTLGHLGLGERCAPLIGATWYRRRGEDLKALCPEVFALPAGAFMRLLADEPATIGVALAKAIAPSQNPFTGYLGFVAGVRHGRFEQVEPWNRSLWEPLFMQLRARHFAALVAFAAVAGVLVTLAYATLLARRRRSPALAVAAYVTLLAAIYAYTLGTSVLGDGFADMGKHAALGDMALAAGLLASIGWIAATWTRHATTAARVATHAILVAAAAATVPLMGIYQRLPLGMGVIDHPGDTRLEPGALQLEGWALDPYGVDAIYARVGPNRYFGRYGIYYPHVALVFPSLPRAAESGWRIDVPAGALGEAHPDVVVHVVNRRGVETEIDRRRLR